MVFVDRVCLTMQKQLCIPLSFYVLGVSKVNYLLFGYQTSVEGIVHRYEGAIMNNTAMGLPCTTVLR